MVNVFQITITILLGAAGGFARQLHVQDSARLNAIGFLGGCFISAFIGSVVYFVTVYFGMDSNLSCALAGVCGWIGPQAMDVISNIVTKASGVDLKLEAKSAEKEAEKEGK